MVVVATLTSNVTVINNPVHESASRETPTIEIKQKDTPKYPSFGVVESEESLKKYLKTRLKEEGIRYKFPIFDTIIQHESGWLPRNDTHLSSAKGLAQIINGTWSDFGCQGHVKNGRDNIDCMIKIYMQDGIVHWCTDWRGNYALRKKGLACTYSMIDPRSWKYK